MQDLGRAVGVDLELDASSRLAMVGAVRGDDSLLREPRGRTDATTTALGELDTFIDNAPFWFGHNVLWHDRPWFAAHASHSRLLDIPVVDTLVLSTIAFAEHPYHALCKDYKLVHDARNDPVADARLAAKLLTDSLDKLRQLACINPTFGRVIHALSVEAMSTVGPEARAGMALCMASVCSQSSNLTTDVRDLLADRVCQRALESATSQGSLTPSSFASLFAVAWLRVAATYDTPSRSVLMPWVRRRFPDVTTLLRMLRDVPCADSACSWCRQIHDPRAHLQRWFEYPDFRESPRLADRRPAQAAIVEAGFADQPHLALLPTGGGKSLCFQLPAIARYVRRGSLTIVVSPLQSLMHDQVENFVHKTHSDVAVALTGRLTPPERHAVLDAIRTGSAGIAYVSPEQLRNSTFASAIAMREIGAWVFDEAHCLSKWGHDFRPDYLYAARFVREHAERTRTPVPPIVCVTATAKPEVREEVIRHFREELGQQLAVFDGHGARQNLTLRVEESRGHDKVRRLAELVGAELTRNLTGSVLVYTATRKNAEEAVRLLGIAGIAAEAFHAGLEGREKKDVQDRFLRGETRVVCATNAFGMGIDKPDIRLVVHYEIPGSLEAYVQEVGRAGRDNQPANAVLLYDPADVETQFSLAARSRLDLRDLQAILRRVRGLARPVRGHDEREAICTSGEILRDEVVAERIDPGDTMSQTRIVTAIAWLERGKFVRRDENATSVFQGRPRVRSMDEARARVQQLDLQPHKQAAWLAILGKLIDAEADEGFSTDDLLGLPAIKALAAPDQGSRAGRTLLNTLFAMQQAELLSRGMQMTAFVRHALADSSKTRLEFAIALEERLVALLRELEPDPDGHQRYHLHLQALTQRLADGNSNVTLDRVRTLLNAAADRGQHAGARTPGLRVTLHGRDYGTAQVLGDWETIEQGVRRRHAVAAVCLETLLAQLTTAKARGKDLLVEFTLEQLLAAMHENLVLRSEPSRDPAAEIEQALLFLHRTNVLVLHKGLAVFRQAMTLRLPKDAPARYGMEQFGALAEHQRERTTQIHFMDEFARRMVSPEAGLALIDDYFRLPKAEFVSRYFPRGSNELDRPTSAESWQRIVGPLSPAQRHIVEAREDASLLVLAGPGSGKTRVVVHRCAWLLRVRRVPASSLLVLCFNRSAALDLRRRLRELVGDDARGVLVQTYHGMAARLIGRSFSERNEAGENDGATFDEVMRRAVTQLELGAGSGSGTTGEGGASSEDELRDRLLVGFRHILVDEYQDIDELQYRLVSAIAGRTLKDPERKLSVLAVGDDDQNIYHWRGSNVKFLRRFEAEYQAQRMPLVENYRSTNYVIAVANQLISGNGDRLKQDTPIRIDDRRCNDAAGGRFAALDTVARGRVHIVELPDPVQQAFAVRHELQRLRTCDRTLDWSQCAVISPRHAPLDAVRELLERDGIPVRFRIDREQSYSLFRLREVQGFLDKVTARGGDEIDAVRLREVVRAVHDAFPRERGVALVEETLAGYLDEHGEQLQPKDRVREFFGEVLMEQRRERTLGDGVLLTTVHGCKGAEFEHVILMDAGWQLRGDNTWEDLRRLYYVGVTRARQTLTLMQCGQDGAPWLPPLGGEAFHRSKATQGLASEATPTLSYDLLGLADVDLSFAGRHPRHEPIDAAIRALATGDPLRLVAADDKLFLDAAGVRVGAVSRAVLQKWLQRLPRIRSVRVAAVVTRGRSDTDEEFLPSLRRDSWQVVIPEVAWSD